MNNLMVINYQSNKKHHVLKKDKFASLSAWIICPVVILFSYMPMLFILARVVFILFILWFIFKLLTGKNKVYFVIPIVTFILWGIYTLLPSLFAINLEVSIKKWVTVILLGIVSLSVANAVAWSGNIRSWAWAFVISCLFSFISNYLPVQSYIEVEYDTFQQGRTVGTFGNANTYGRVMVEAAMISVFLILKEKSFHMKIILLVITVVFGYAVLQSESRTALVGFILLVIFTLHSTRWEALKIKYLPISIFILTAFFYLIASFPDKFTSILLRINILLGYLGLGEKIKTRDRSLDHREALIDTAWNTWLNNPFGVGLDNYQLISGVYAHSNYFELLASVGIIGVIFYYLSFWFFYRWIKYNRNSFEKPSHYKFILSIILISIAMDISNVSYYSKPFWLMISILSGFVVITINNKKFS